MEVHNPIARAAAKLRQHGHEAEATNLEQFADNFAVPQSLIDAIHEAGLTLVRELTRYRILKLGDAVADTSKLSDSAHG